jgi:hypothetical protein
MKHVKKFKSFNDFLINESIVKYSPRFLSLLNNIYKDEPSDLVKDLISMNTGDFDIDKNYIDIGKDSDTITFTDNKKAEKLFSELSDKDLSYRDILDQIFSKQRQPMKIGGFVRSFLKSSGKNYTDKEIHDFVNMYKSFAENENNFKLVSGDDISLWYNVNNYEEVKSTLGSSCMREVDKEYFEIYTKNPDKVSLLILMGRKDTNKIRGRAIVWKAETSNDSYKSITFMDRVYYTDDSDLFKFQNYAKEKGWGYKSNNDSKREVKLTINADSFYTNVSVDLENSIFSYYPYLDTLKYLNSDGVLSNEPETGDLILTSTRGGSEIYCNTCGNRGIANCPDCGGDGDISCEDCNGRGYIDCEVCDGDHRITCDDCEGGGLAKCGECGGRGEKDGEKCECDDGGIICGNCDGDGWIECGECDRDGDIPCKVCDTRGNISCSRCGGDGQIDCEECSRFR